MTFFHLEPLHQTVGADDAIPRDFTLNVSLLGKGGVRRSDNLYRAWAEERAANFENRFLGLLFERSVGKQGGAKQKGPQTFSPSEIRPRPITWCRLRQAPMANRIRKRLTWRTKSEILFGIEVGLCLQSVPPDPSPR